MSIPNINIQEPQVFAGNIRYIPYDIKPNAIIRNIHPPITVNIGFPIVDIPGCVEVHPANETKNRPVDKNLVNDDPKGAMTICPTGQYPSYNAINFEPEQTLPTIAAAPPPIAPPVPELPDTGKVVPNKKVECPGPNAPRIGDVAQNQKERVSGYELNKDETICIILYEDIPFTSQYLPAPQVVATTGGIAAVAATSALLAKPIADLLLKVVKPVVKQVITKIKMKLGVSIEKPNRAEIRANEYRLKKGLLPLKKAKKKK